MKALVFGGPGQRSWDTADDPSIVDPTDAIVQIDTTTICGTDLHILKGDVPAVTEGRILGHEAVGTVVETGAAVTSLKKGDRVLVPAITLMRPLRELQGRDGGHCQGAGGIGWIFGHLINGLQAQYARVPFAETSVHLVPDGVSDEQVLFLSDILPTGYEIGVQNGGVKPGDTMAVVGAGPVGLAAMMTAAIAGARGHRGRPRPLPAGARGELRRRPHGRRRGRRPRGGPGADRRSGRRRRDGGRRRAGDVRPLHRGRAPGRHVANIGVHGAPTTLHLEELWIKNITITTGLVSGSTVPTLLALAREGRIEAEKLGTHHFKFGEIEQAYDVFGAADEHDALKVVITA